MQSVQNAFKVYGHKIQSLQMKYAESLQAELLRLFFFFWGGLNSYLLLHRLEKSLTTDINFPPITMTLK